MGSGREQAPRGPARRPDPIGARLAAELQAGSPGQRVALALLLVGLAFLAAIVGAVIGVALVALNLA